MADGVTDFFTHQIIQQTHYISIVHAHVLLCELLKNVIGLKFYDNRPKWPILFTMFRLTVLCSWISIGNTGDLPHFAPKHDKLL